MGLCLKKLSFQEEILKISKHNENDENTDEEEEADIGVDLKLELGREKFVTGGRNKRSVRSNKP